MNARIPASPFAPTPVRAEDALGHIAVQVPGATAVFRRLKLDFCCGGQISLAQAAADRGLPLADLLAELNALQRSDAVPQEASTPELIAHILGRFHEVHRQELPELIRMARRVEAVHRDHPDVPEGLAAHLENMEQELLGHMAKEEQILFPMMVNRPGAGVNAPIQVMRMEHTDHGERLDTLMELTHDALPPEGACNTWRALYAGIQKLQDDLINHIHLENNVLFPVYEALSKPVAASTGGCGGSGGGCACSH